LVVAQRRRVDGGLDTTVFQHADAGIDAADELLDESLLECEQ
jgi:hypothetical protein